MANISILIIAILFFLIRKKPNEEKINFYTGKICSKYESYIIAASILFNVPAKIIDAMVFVESYDGVNLNHSHGEVGIMAVKPDTAKDVIKKFPKIGQGDLRDFRYNILVGTGYLKMGYDVWGNWKQAIVGYNMGFKNPNIRNYENNDYLKRVLDRIKVVC